MSLKCLTQFLPMTAAVLAAALLSAPPSVAGGTQGAVYVTTNDASGNSILMYGRDSHGALRFLAKVPTGGKGIGGGLDPLGSQGSIILSRDSRLLFAVNAGSNDISEFAVTWRGLVLVGTFPSGGMEPVSLTVQGDVLFVLNAGGTPSVDGFRIDPFTSRLKWIAGSKRALPGGTGAGGAQVQFSPGGDALIVTEKATSQIDVFPVDNGGRLDSPKVFPSNGSTPFGFDFTRRGLLLVSEAGGGAGGTSATSSYHLQGDDDDNLNLELIDGSAPDFQKAGCWLVVSMDNRFAYVANAATGVISGYQVDGDGGLTLLNADGNTAMPGGAPLDMNVTDNGRFLYALNPVSGTINGFRINGDGSLTPVANAVAGISLAAQGLAAQ
jgi:6-phosphogluconolactonase (cycloisomerase 2 family)